MSYDVGYGLGLSQRYVADALDYIADIYRSGSYKPEFETIEQCIVKKFPDVRDDALRMVARMKKEESKKK